MPHRQYRNGHFSPHDLSFGPQKKVNQLLEAGVIDAQALNRGTVTRLASKLGMEEIDRARSEAERIAGETGYMPSIFGRELVEVVRIARAAQSSPTPEQLDARADERRTEIYARMAQAAVKATGTGQAA